MFAQVLIDPAKIKDLPRTCPVIPEVNIGKENLMQEIQPKTIAQSLIKRLLIISQQ